MWKIVFDGKDFQKVTAPDEPLKQGFVKIKPTFYSICGTDKSIVSGKWFSRPVALGHEISGYVVEGSGTDMKGERIEKGDYVALYPNYYCGECIECKHGNFNACRNKRMIGVREDGGLSEYMIVEPKFLLKLPKDMREELGPLVEPTAVGVHALKKFNDLKRRLVIIGLGGTGSLAYKTALLLGFNDVTAVEKSDKKLKIARELGLKVFHSLIEAIDDEPVNILDTVGDEKSIAEIESAMDRIPAGSEIVITGLGSDVLKFHRDVFIRRELTIKGSIIYNPSDFIEASRLLYAHQREYLKLVTKVEDKINNLNELKSLILDDSNIKTVIRIQ